MSTRIGIENADGITFGARVVVSPMLPIKPSPGEDGRRIVRHGMADILRWLGEEPGPKPGEPQHTILGWDPGDIYGDLNSMVLFASREYVDSLKTLTDPRHFSLGPQETNS